MNILYRPIRKISSIAGDISLDKVFIFVYKALNPPQL